MSNNNNNNNNNNGNKKEQSSVQTNNRNSKFYRKDPRIDKANLPLRRGTLRGRDINKNLLYRRKINIRNNRGVRKRPKIKPRYNQPATNIVKRQLNKPRTKNKLHYLLNPMNAVLERKLFSVFFSEDKIMRFGVFTSWNFTTSTTENYNSLWFPLGAAMAQYVWPRDKDNATCDKFASFWWGTTSTQSCHCMYQNQITVFGKYRVIGSEMKITNTTNMTNRGGNYLVGEVSIEDVAPLYVNKNTFVHDSLDIDINSIKACYGTSLANIATKQMYTADDICLIRFVNAYESNRIYSNYNEYLQSVYVGNTISSGHCVRENDEVVGNNIGYVINWYMTSAVQTYLIELYSVVEVIPDPSRNMGMATYPSTSKLNNYEQRAVNNYSKLIRLR